MIIDTHAHYDSDGFAEDRDTLLASMQEIGIGLIVNSCASVDGLQDTIDWMEKYDFVYGAVGVHPDDADKMTAEYEAPFVLLYDQKITNLQAILPVLEAVLQSGRALLIVAEDIEGGTIAERI